MNSIIIRFSGVAAVLGGIFFLYFAIVTAGGGDLDGNQLIKLVMPLVPLLLAFGAVGLLYLGHAHTGVKGGAIIMGLGAVVIAAGFGLMSWLENDNGWALMFLGLVLHPVGLLLFGAANWRARVLPRGNKGALLVGFLTCLLLIFGTFGAEATGLSERQSELIFSLYLLVIALGWLLFGVNMVTAAPDRPASTPTANIS